MDTVSKAEAFTERVRVMTERLREQLLVAEPAVDISASELLEELYAQGKELGLTDKEITQQVIRPVAELLRPGLTR